MRIDIIAVIPEILEGPLSQSIVQRAQNKGIVEIHVHSLRNYTEDHYKSVDDYAYGGGAGMVIKVEPVFKVLEKLKRERNYDEIIYVTPDGKPFHQQTANRLSTLKNIIILCGHYKGIDQRIRDHLVTMDISIGDYVISAGELAAAVITDAVVRLIPGVLNDETSALTDSFQDYLLAPPVYTRPEVFNNWKVPDILLSGNQKKIDQWRLEHSLKKTKKIRPDLWKKMEDRTDPDK
ncbi:MAG TPA: tRNA (guanosine(37)-N1)-methyltransferase TrmD [Bacteroidetes bacterium]|nr:tRNA (guanosine(37)-N1)-methyltransferase TrmD [Bacteroidota bacterium]